MSIVDRCGCVSFDRRRVFCLVLSSTVACCDESWIINSFGGRLSLLDWNRVVVDMRIYECQAQLCTWEFKTLHRAWVLPIGILSTSIGSAASSEGVLMASGGLFEGLGCGLSAFRRATSVFGICTWILTTLQDAVDSVGVVDRCSGEDVYRFWMTFVDRCSEFGVDRHQCDPPKLIKLSTSKSPSCSFSWFTTC
ncbi:hypothetical protein DY000_02029549 [Brassica cretica]|uniref:Prolamin-like domain-containing protein n=1 Tax=Brassica cretica TaxID=69181 RepID=A0ABQ7DYM3_BRACR|nr:hypothetical protein DY000_02029549 [Brassica cretica]